VPGCKNYKWLNPVWHRMFCSCTHMATVRVKGLNASLSCISYTLAHRNIFLIFEFISFKVYKIEAQINFVKFEHRTDESAGSGSV